MAGLGFRTFVSGEVLTAANVNGYLMEQAVMVFASASARSTALAAPSEGMVSYLTDTNVIQYYDGAAWVGVVQNALVNAKGDLITATANDTPAILTAGSNGQMLMADSSATAGLRYVDPPANRNLIINGNMAVFQRGASSSAALGSGYLTADRWRIGYITLGEWTQSIEDDAPTGSGFRKSFKVLCTAAEVSPAAGDFLNFNQPIEGQDLQRIRKGTSDAQQLTLSFWVKSNVTGTYIAELRDIDNSRQVSASYTISASATWERKTITFPADTTGAFDNDNARSLDVAFTLAVGSNFSSGTLNTTWASSTDANRAVGQTNLAAAANNYWQITGVQLETGIATPFEFEPYEATLRKCQRYYYRHTGADEDYLQNICVVNATSAIGVYNLPTVMRISPTLETTGTAGNYKVYANGTKTTCSAVPAKDSGSTNLFNGIGVSYTVASGLTGGHGGIAIFESTPGSPYIAFSAEL